MSTLISLTTNIELKEEDKLNTDWSVVPSYTVPQLLPAGVSFAVNVKNTEIDPVTNHAKWVRVSRQYDMYTDTFTQRVDYLINPDHEMFKPHDVDESTSVGDAPMEGESIEAGFACNGILYRGVISVLTTSGGSLSLGGSHACDKE